MSKSISISYPLSLLQNSMFTKLAIENDPSLRQKFNSCFAHVDGNNDGQIDSQEWASAKISDDFKKICAEQGIAFEQVACRLNALFHPVASHNYSFTIGTAQIKHEGTEHLILFDVNSDGVFNPSEGDSMELIAPTFEGCWICLVGTDNTSGPLVAIVKSQDEYAGKTIQKISAEISQSK